MTSSGRLVKESHGAVAFLDGVDEINEGTDHSRKGLIQAGLEGPNELRNFYNKEGQVWHEEKQEIGPTKYATIKKNKL